MADAKLTALTAASALAAADLFYVSQSAASRKATGTQLLALVGTAYVPLAGGTMTGALKLPAGAVDTPSLMFTGAGATTGFYSTGLNNVSLAVGGNQIFYCNTNTLWIAGATGAGLLGDNSLFYFGGLSDTILRRDAAATLAQRNGTNAQTLRVYGTYTDSSNYERLTLSTTAGTSVNIAAETLGTGGDNLDIVLTPAGTGSVYFPVGASATPGIRFLGKNAGFWSTSSYIACRGVNADTVDLVFGSTVLRTGSGHYFGWSSSSDPTVAVSDTALYRNAPGIVEVNNGTAATYRDLKLRNLLNVEYHQMTEMTAPSAPATNSVRIYAEDNGAGKTRLMALFATGSAVQLGIEP